MQSLVHIARLLLIIYLISSFTKGVLDSLTFLNLYLFIDLCQAFTSFFGIIISRKWKKSVSIILIVIHVYWTLLNFILIILHLYDKRTRKLERFLLLNQTSKPSFFYDHGFYCVYGPPKDENLYKESAKVVKKLKDTLINSFEKSIEPHFGDKTLTEFSVDLFRQMLPQLIADFENKYPNTFVGVKKHQDDCLFGYREIEISISGLFLILSILIILMSLSIYRRKNHNFKDNFQSSSSFKRGKESIRKLNGNIALVELDRNSNYNSFRSNQQTHKNMENDLVNNLIMKKKHFVGKLEEEGIVDTTPEIRPRRRLASFDENFKRDKFFYAKPPRTGEYFDNKKEFEINKDRFCKVASNSQNGRIKYDANLSQLSRFTKSRGSVV